MGEKDKKKLWCQGGVKVSRCGGRQICVDLCMGYECGCSCWHFSVGGCSSKMEEAI